VPKPTTVAPPSVLLDRPASAVPSAVPTAPTGAAPANGGEIVTVKTDLFEIELNTLGW
jgi:hypothetical protein